MEDNRHKIEKIEECEEMIKAQRTTAIYNAIFCGMWSYFCATDVYSLITDENPFMIIMALLSGYFGFNHFSNFNIGCDIIKENKEKIKELKK